MGPRQIQGRELSRAGAPSGLDQSLLFHGSLECRRCVVVGNGHRLRNSSLGDTIDKYDVVIRYV
jgi:hypothetical protein